MTLNELMERASSEYPDDLIAQVWDFERGCPRDNPGAGDTLSNIKLKGLRSFMDEYKCRRGYVIGNFREPEKLERGITALPWWMV